MSWFSVTKDIVGGAWDIGTDIYNATSDALSESIDEETKKRLKKKGLGNLTKRDYEYIQERAIVKKEFQDVGLKGGAMLLGVGLIV